MKKLLALGLALAAWQVQAQVLSDQSIKHTPALPPPPEAAALGKFGHTPVGLYTGVAQISIPIYTLKVPNFELPISLDYHAGGIRVSELASNVGLGWALRAGGLVSSTTVGLADFDVSDRGYAHQVGIAPIPVDRQLAPGGFNMLTGIGNADYMYMRTVTACPVVTPYPDMNGSPLYGFDTQPDIFHYSMGGRSGQFFHTQDGKAHPMPFAPILITRLPGGNASPWQHGNGYLIVDEQGNRFTFDRLEVSVTALTKFGMPTNPADETYPHAFVFHLSKIRTVRGDSLTFAYDTLTYRYRNVTTRTRFRHLGGLGCANRQQSRVESYSVVKSLIIKKITSSTGEEVAFEYDHDFRHDLTGSRALAAIVVQQGSLVRRFTLTHDYFGTIGGVALPDESRLRLTAVQEVGKPPYTLTYQLPALGGFPHRLSPQEDHWGFINNPAASASASSTVSDGFNSQDFPLDPANGFSIGYSRDPDSLAMLTGMLRELHYPTGGFTRFVFEPNGFPTKADSITSTAQQSIQIYSDSLSNGLHHLTLPWRHAFGHSIRAIYDTPPYGNADPQFYATLFRASQSTTPLEIFAGTSPGRNLSQASLFNNNDTYSLDVYKSGSSPDKYIYLVWDDQVKTAAGGQFYCSGGVRIRETLDFDGLHAEPAQRQRYYYTALDTTKSSAVTLSTTPQYIRYLDEYVHSNGQPLNPTANAGKCNWLMQTTNTQAPLSTIQGSTTAYTSVLVLSDRHGVQGLTQHKFSFANDTNLHAGYPFTPPTSYEWERGLPLEQTDYRYVAATHNYSPVKRTRSHYASHLTTGSPTVIVADDDLFSYTPADQPNEAHALGLNLLVQTPQYVVTPNGGYNSFPYHVAATFINEAYKLISAWNYKDSEQVTLFDAADSTKQTTTATFFHYDNPRHAQLTSTVATAGAGDSLLTRIQYPLDFDTAAVSSASARAIRLLARTHQLGIALETQHWRYHATAGYRLLHGELTEYLGRWPRRLQAVITSQPLAAFTGASIAQGTLSRDSHYQDALWFDRYDARGNPLGTHRPSGSATAFLWQTSTGELLTSAQNCRYDQFASTSFEPAATGRWRYDSLGTHRTTGGRTGQWAYWLDGTASVSRDQLPAGDYEVSYWIQGSTTPLLSVTGGTVLGNAPQLLAQAANNWQQYRTRLHLASTGQVSLDVPAGSAALRLDEVRLYPVGARLTSYTRDPLVGVTSQTGPDGRTTYYEYDALGRLVRTRDEQGRILTEQQYHYAGQ